MPFLALIVPSLAAFAPEPAVGFALCHPALHGNGHSGFV
jgi:hypothetical protein